MEIIKHTKFIYEYVDAVSPEVCDEIVSLVDSVDIRDDMLFTKTKLRNNDAVNLSEHRSFHPNITRAEDIVNQIFLSFFGIWQLFLHIFYVNNFFCFLI